MEEKEKNTLDEYDEISYIDYDEEAFVIIDKENELTVIPALCNAIFAHHLSDEDGDTAVAAGRVDEVANLTDDNEAYVSGKQFLMRLLKKLPKPLTVVQEGYHIDRSFIHTTCTSRINIFK